MHEIEMTIEELQMVKRFTVMFIYSSLRSAFHVGSEHNTEMIQSVWLPTLTYLYGVLFW